MLLLYPPLAKSCEAPAGIMQLAGCLQAHGLPCHSMDLNIGAIHHLLALPQTATDTWTRRAIKNRERNTQSIQTQQLYLKPDRYKKCVLELNRLLSSQGKGKEHLTLANYQHQTLSPHNSHDLIQVFEHPEENIFSAYFNQILPQILEEDQPDAIGISLTFMSQALATFSLIGIIKKLLSGCPVIVGGGLMTSWMRSPSWTNPFTGVIDHCVAGAGEEQLLSFYGKRQEQPNRMVWPDTAGASYLAPRHILPIPTSGGCFWNRCNFCPERAEGSRFSRKEYAQVRTEMDLLTATTDNLEHEADSRQHLIHFLDNAIPPATLRQLANNPPFCPWYGFVRISHHLLDLDFCLALHRSGCRMLKIGLESADQYVLDSMEKGTRIDMIEQVLANLKRAGIATYVYLLFGTPQETHERALSTLNFVRAHHQEISYLNLAIFNMPHNSPDAKHYTLAPISKEADLSLYTDFVHPHGWGRRQIRQFLDKELKRTPEISAIIQRDPPFFTSNHAAFFTL